MELNLTVEGNVDGVGFERDARSGRFGDRDRRLVARAKSGRGDRHRAGTQGRHEALVIDGGERFVGRGPRHIDVDLLVVLAIALGRKLHRAPFDDRSLVGRHLDASEHRVGIVIGIGVDIGIGSAIRVGVRIDAGIRFRIGITDVGILFGITVGPGIDLDIGVAIDIGIGITVAIAVAIDVIVGLGVLLDATGIVATGIVATGIVGADVGQLHLGAVARATRPQESEKGNENENRAGWKTTARKPEPMRRLSHHSPTWNR